MTKPTKKQLRYMEMLELYTEVFPLVSEFDQFFDSESREDMEVKMKVFTDLKAGKSISDIPEFYDVFKIPENEMWD